MTTPHSPPSSGSFPSMAADASRSTLKVPIRFTPITREKGSSACAPRRPATFSAQPIPAQQTEILTPFGTAAATSASSVTSQRTNRAPSSPASAVPASSLRSAMVTSAPLAASRRALAAPSPLAPPATSATAPSIRMRASYRDAAARRDAHHRPRLPVRVQRRAGPDPAALALRRRAPLDRAHDRPHARAARDAGLDPAELARAPGGGRRLLDRVAQEQLALRAQHPHGAGAQVRAQALAFDDPQ